MSLQAYRSASQRVETPRELEYRLFSEVTRSLVEADALGDTDVGPRMEALDWNRRVWATLAGACAMDDNALPDATRANIISLSLWVDRHSQAVFRKEEGFGPLIEVNRLVMQGLAA
jgi:flagellar biosynthesis activator protein FlaF